MKVTLLSYVRLYTAVHARPTVPRHTGRHIDYNQSILPHSKTNERIEGDINYHLKVAVSVEILPGTRLSF